MYARLRLLLSAPQRHSVGDSTEGAYEKTIYLGQTLHTYRKDRAAFLSPAAVNPKVQRVPGTVLRSVFRSVSFGADPSFAQEPEPLHPLIRTGSPGRGGLCHIRPVCRRAWVYVVGGAACAG